MYLASHSAEDRTPALLQILRYLSHMAERMCRSEQLTTNKKDAVKPALLMIRSGKQVSDTRSLHPASRPTSLLVFNRPG